MQKNSEGLKGHQILETFYNLFCRCQLASSQQVHVVSWEDLDEAHQDAFEATIAKLVSLIEAADGTPVRQLAEAGHREFQRYIPDGCQQFGQLPREDQILWDTAVRHLAFALSYNTEHDGMTVNEAEGVMLDRFCMKAFGQTLQEREQRAQQEATQYGL